MRPPARPAPAPTHATASSSRGVGRGHGVRAVAVAALACAALLGFSATAQAQTDVWSATLTVKELSPNSSTFGCTNTTSSVRCSDFLSEDEFTYDSTDYAITAIFLTRNAQLQLHFDTDLTTAAQTLTLDVAGTTFAFEDAHVKGAAQRSWSRSGLSWSADDAVVLRLIETPATANNAPVFTDGANTTRSVAENTTASTNIGTAIAATDADSGDTLRYTLGGTDAASFAIVSTSGQLQTSAALDFETTSSYAVTVSVSDGNGGTDSIGVTITVTDVDEQPATPAAPSVGATANVHTSLDVSWTAPGLNGGPAITGYDLQYRPGTSGSFTNGPQNVSGTSAAIAGLAAGTSYQVQVRALNGETPSDWSSVGTGSTLAASTAPEVPRTLTAAPGDGQVVLTWTVPANTVSAILRYEHRYKVTSATNFPATWTSAGTALTATVGSLTNGTPYSFEVRAVNTVGAGTAATTSATPTATTRATDLTLTLAAGPTRFGEADGSVQICVVPSAVSTQRITVQVATADGTATAPGDYVSYSSQVALQPQQQQACFTVTLVDDADAEGDETFTVTLSNPVNATLGARAVATFTIVDNENVAATGTPTISGTAQVGQVLTAGPGTIADANGLTRPRYRYQWLRADTEVATGTAITGAMGRTYTLADADVGKYIKVRLSFTDDANNSESRTSNATPAVQAAPPPRSTTPGPPTGVTVTSGDRQVTVDWAGVSGATGYTVQWKSGSEAYAASRQQTVTASRTTISGLTNGTTYTVRVRTRHAGGTSDWSAEAMVTPGPPAPVPTLPAVAAGLLALLLVGRGMALLRRRLPGQPT